MVPIERTRRKGAAWTPTEESREVVVVRPDGDDFVVTVRGVSGVKQSEPIRRIPLPTVAADARYTWRLRTGPTGTALLSVSAPGSEQPEQAWSIGPGASATSEPLFVPEGLVGPGQHLVADGIGGLVRLRAVTGEDAEEVTRAVVVLDPNTGRHHDITRKGDVDADLWAALSNRALRDRAGDGTIMLRAPGDPMMDRIAPGESSVRFERCRLVDP